MAKPKLTNADWERIWQEKFAIEEERFDLTPKSSLGQELRPLRHHIDSLDLDKIHDYKYKNAREGHVIHRWLQKTI